MRVLRVIINIRNKVKFVILGSLLFVLVASSPLTSILKWLAGYFSRSLGSLGQLDWQIHWASLNVHFGCLFYFSLHTVLQFFFTEFISIFREFIVLKTNKIHIKTNNNSTQPSKVFATSTMDLPLHLLSSAILQSYFDSSVR